MFEIVHDGDRNNTLVYYTPKHSVALEQLHIASLMIVLA